MNLKLNGRGFHTAGLLLIIIVLLQLTKAEVNAPELCIRDLVKSYGFQGFEKPEIARLEMCPMIKYSCCKPNDQVMMFKNWVISGESSDLINKFRTFQKTYRDVLDEAMEVYRLAEVLTAKLNDRPISNCKVLANQVLRFDLRNLNPKLLEVAKNFYAFLYEQYKGFYCAICDATTHKEFDLVRKEVTFSQKFCRNIVANSLHFLLYFHLHVSKYLNLQLKFLNFCDGAGNFEEKFIDEQLFDENPVESMLLTCRDELNSPVWFSKCSQICAQFNMVEFNEFFVPLKDKYIETLVRLQELRIKLDGSLRRNAPLEYVKKTKGLRVLAANETNSNKEDGTTNQAEDGTNEEVMTERQKKELEAKMKENAVYKSQTILVDLSTFKRVFSKDYGIDYSGYGRNTTYDEGLYNKMKSVMEKAPDGGPTEKPSNKGVEDSTNNTARVSVLISALILFLSTIVIA